MGLIVAALFLQSMILLFSSNEVTSIACEHNYCDSVKCVPDDQLICQEGEEKEPKSTYCGCCTSCIYFLERGESCVTPWDGHKRCRPPTSCIDSRCELM
ncbi:hypothetical protein C0J52_18730 [Blattella germanica]|nr:hypothetical protein C0J52_18730 [Blattella germanica]